MSETKTLTVEERARSMMMRCGGLGGTGRRKMFASQINAAITQATADKDAEIERLKERAMHAELLAEQLGRELEDQILPRPAAPSSEAIERVAGELAQGWCLPSVRKDFTARACELIAALCPPSSEGDELYAAKEELRTAKELLASWLNPPGAPCFKSELREDTKEFVAGTSNVSPSSAESPVVNDWNDTKAMRQFEGIARKVECYVEVYEARGKLPPEMNDAVSEMLAICTATKSTEDERRRALDTIAEAITPPAESEGLVWKLSVRCGDEVPYAIDPSDDAFEYTVEPAYREGDWYFHAMRAHLEEIDDSENLEGFAVRHFDGETDRERCEKAIDAAKAACEQHYKQSKGDSEPVPAEPSPSEPDPADRFEVLLIDVPDVPSVAPGIAVRLKDEHRSTLYTWRSAHAWQDGSVGTHAAGSETHRVLRRYRLTPIE